MKKIYILLMHTNTIPSNFVKVFTRYQYSHVAISLTKDCYKTYSFGRRSLYNILNGGLSIQNKDGEFFNRFNKTNCKIYELEITDDQYDDLKKELERMEENIDDYKYDFLGIVPRWLSIPITFENKYVCSYFIAHILEKTQICEFEKDVCFVVPKDFENVQGIRPIYTGKYLAYT